MKWQHGIAIHKDDDDNDNEDDNDNKDDVFVLEKNGEEGF